MSASAFFWNGAADRTRKRADARPVAVKVAAPSLAPDQRVIWSHHTGFFLLLASCLTTSNLACSSSPLWPGNWFRGNGRSESASTARVSGGAGDLGRPTMRRVDPAVSVGVTFEVARVEIRSAEMRDALKIWNHVDESRLDPAVAVRLARNGIRLGVGAPASWPAIRAILEAGEASVRKDEMAPQRGLPLAIGIDKVAEGETIFTYGRDDRLAGRTFDAGEKVLNTDYFLLSDRDSRIDLEATLEVRRDRGEMTWERRAGSIEETPAIDRHLFPEAAARISLAKDEFLLVGAAADATNRYLLGPRFFTNEHGGQTFDVLLFVTPRTLRSDSPSRPGT